MIINNYTDLGPRALYIHLPFCKTKCAYCSFKSFTNISNEVKDSYLEKLLVQIKSLHNFGLLSNVETIYLGGGTPSFFGHKRLVSLCYFLATCLNFSKITEFTLEANPDSISQTLVADLYALGVNRFSLGVQSFLDAELKQFGRVHDAAQAMNAIETIKTRTNNFSIDLICGSPFQSLSSLEYCLNKVIEIEPVHVSVYPLSIEENTIFAKNGMKVDDDFQADCLLAIEDKLCSANYNHYEISSYSKKGLESQHNLSYWTAKQYIGLGSFSCSCLSKKYFETFLKALPCKSISYEGLYNDVARVRFCIENSIDDFIRNNSLTISCDNLSSKESQLEDLMLGARLLQGIPSSDIDKLNPKFLTLQNAIDKLCEQNLLNFEQKSKTYKYTKGGWLCANEVFSAIWNAKDD